jgi:hypothetical protein
VIGRQRSGHLFAMAKNVFADTKVLWRMHESR